MSHITAAARKKADDKKKKIEDEKKRKEALEKKIPKELQFIINTDIPGSQEFEYVSSMTIPELKNNKLLFNPLIFFSKKTINSIPVSVRQKQFFDKGLFQSLLYHINKSPVENLAIANSEGYIDNNIRVTIDTLFPLNGIFYVKGKPHKIVSVEWNTGDFEIKEKKILPKTPVIPSRFAPVAPVETVMTIFVPIDLILYPGTETNFSPKEVNQLKCNHRWNSVRKSYYELIGKKFFLPPNYKLLEKDTSTSGEKIKKGGKIKQNKKQTRKIKHKIKKTIKKYY